MKHYRRWMLWFCVGALAIIVAIMIAQARRAERELALAGLLDTCDDIDRARAEELVNAEDLPMLLRLVQ